MNLSGIILSGALLISSSASAQDAAAIAREASLMAQDYARSAQDYARAAADAGYSQGTRALDNRQYEAAIQQFDRVIAAKTDRADGALYWKAYALNRLGRSDEARTTIATLRRDYPNSRWLNDAQALEAEAKQGSGKPVSPADESNDDLKLMAINSLMNADPAKALPLLDGILKGSSSPKLKDRAIFVLTQNHSPEAQKLLTDYAGGAANPDLQLRAIRYLGMGGTPETRQQLTSLYRKSNDMEVKKAILMSVAISGDGSGALDLARDEKNPTLRGLAIRDAAMTGKIPSESLVKLYGTEADIAVKREIVNSLMMRGDAKTLVDLARKETNPEMKKTIVERLSMMGKNKEATDYMLELLK